VQAQPVQSQPKSSRMTQANRSESHVEPVCPPQASKVNWQEALSGSDDGMLLGTSDGMLVGSFDGMLLGTSDGMLVGSFDRMLVGSFDGMLVGSFDGMLIGSFDGMLIGSFDGMLVVALVGKIIVAFFAASALQHSDPVYDDKMLPQVTFTVSNIAAFVISSAQQEFS